MFESQDGRLYLLDAADARVLARFERGMEGILAPAYPLLADLDGDGAADALVAARKPLLAALDLRGIGRTIEPADRRHGPLEDARLLAARRAAATGAWRAVETIVQPLLAGGPGGPTTAQARALRGSARLWRGDRAGGLEDLRRAIRDLPREPRARIDLAFATDSAAEAADSLSAALLLAPGSTWSTIRDRQATWSDTWRRRIAFTLRAVASGLADPPPGVDPDRAGLARALALLLLGQPGDALAVLDPRVGARPLDPDLRRFRGRARLEAGDPAGALEDWRTVRALEHPPPDLEAWMAEARRALEAKGR